MKKISVIVPVYGVERFIASTIQSVLQQSYQNFELLLVDDGSRDHSVEICQQFSDPRIRIIRQANRGLAGARNTGIRYAEGEYLAFLDGDDMWHPEKLEKHIQHLESAPEVGVSYCPSALMDESGRLLNSYLMPKLTDIDLVHFCQENPIGNGSSPVVRRAVFDAIKFQDDDYTKGEVFYFDEHFRRAEDIECWLRILIQTPWRFEGIPEPLTYYRVNSGGLSANLQQQQAALEQVLQKIKQYAPAIAKEWGDKCMANWLRYLARNAIRIKSGTLAVQLIHRALRLHWRVFLDSPRRTFMTLVAAYMLWLLPNPLYLQLEKLAVSSLSTVQQRQLQKEWVSS